MRSGCNAEHRGKATPARTIKDTLLCHGLSKLTMVMFKNK